MTTLPVHPDLEAFFIAVALQHGIGPEQLNPENIPTREWRNILKNHPGKPEVLQQVHRMQHEMQLGFSPRISQSIEDDGWFWTNLTYSMVQYLREHYGDTHAVG